MATEGEVAKEELEALASHEWAVVGGAVTVAHRHDELVVEAFSLKRADELHRCRWIHVLVALAHH